MQHLIDWKTNAWKDRGMVAWYSGRMFESGHRLKHQVEMQLIEPWVSGRRFVDVGVGTGRAAIHFAQKGYDVLGIDSSQAMLDETMRLAGDLPVKTMRGDVTCLPVGEAEFDTLISLNVVVHFPHLSDILREFRRIVRPGGRIIFDIHVYDHLEAVYGVAAAKQFVESQRLDNYQRFASAEEIVDLANKLDLSVMAMSPYGVFCNANHWLSDIQGKHWWRRTIDWIPFDSETMLLANQMESSVAAKLPTIACARMMVVLELSPPASRNDSWLLDNQRRNQLLSSLDIELLGPFIEKIFELASLAKKPRTGMLIFDLLSVLVRKAPNFNWRKLFPVEMSARFDEWFEQDCIDMQSMQINSKWHCNNSARQPAALMGVELGPVLEYPLQQQLLTEYFHVFSKVN